MIYQTRTPFTNTSATHDISNTQFTKTNTNTPNKNNISQTRYIHNMCDIINIPSGSPLLALIRDNAGTIKWPVAVHVRCPSAWLRWRAIPTSSILASLPGRLPLTQCKCSSPLGACTTVPLYHNATPLLQIYTFTYVCVTMYFMLLWAESFSGYTALYK